jgi:hypothetical protein
VDARQTIGTGYGGGTSMGSQVQDIGDSSRGSRKPGGVPRGIRDGGGRRTDRSNNGLGRERGRSAGQPSGDRDAARFAKQAPEVMGWVEERAKRPINERQTSDVGKRTQ